MMITTTNYIIHEHFAKRAGRHYDLRIQNLNNFKLSSFAIPKARFPEDSKDKLLAVKTPDHPSKWLNINRERIKGSGSIYKKPTYGEGTIRSIQKGRAVILFWNNDKIVFVVSGPVADGKFTLIRYKSKSTDLNTWILLKNKEEN